MLKDLNKLEIIVDIKDGGKAKTFLDTTGCPNQELKKFDLYMDLITVGFNTKEARSLIKDLNLKLFAVCKGEDGKALMDSKNKPVLKQMYPIDYYNLTDKREQKLIDFMDDLRASLISKSIVETINQEMLEFSTKLDKDTNVF